jgi:hypothetical protein
MHSGTGNHCVEPLDGELHVPSSEAAAIPNWTGQLPVAGLPLWGLFLRWVAGRLVMLAIGVCSRRAGLLGLLNRPAEVPAFA